MKQNETDYLDKLFASSSDATDEAEVAFPSVEMPSGLSERLHQIADKAPCTDAPIADGDIKPVARFGTFFTLPKLSAVAASLFIALFGFQFYQQQQTLRQLEQAQADLATALHYLGEANRIARAQVIDSLNDNIKKAGVEPAMEVGRDTVLPNLQDLEPETQTTTRSL